MVEFKEMINKVICIDCKEGLKYIPNYSIDLIVTSPPYFNARPEYADYANVYYLYLREMAYVMKECYRVLKKGGVIAWNIGDAKHEGLDLSSDASNLLRDAGFRFIDKIVWQKPSGVGMDRIGETMKKTRKYYPLWTTEMILVYCKGNEPNLNILSDYELAILESKYKTDVWYLQPESNVPHPAAFPEELVVPFVLAYTRKGDIVFDPFCGSATTCVVAKKYGRKYIGFDYVEEYCKYANERLAKTNEITNKTLQLSLEHVEI